MRSNNNNYLSLMDSNQSATVAASDIEMLAHVCWLNQVKSADNSE